jgi:transposase
VRKLEGVEAADLKSALEDAESAKAAKRLMIALAYKDGVDVTEIERRYGIPQSTVYYWLNRLEERPLQEALTDERRPGRPPKLTAEQRATVDSWLSGPPESGDEASVEWTAKRLRRRIRQEFDVDYSIPHVSRTFLD